MTRRIGIGVLGAAVIAAGVLALSGPAGQRLRVSVDGRAIGEAPVDPPSRVTVDRWSEDLDASRIRLRWDGLIDVPEGPSRFLSVFATGRVTIAVDGRVLLEKTETHGVEERTSSLPVRAGRHLVTVDYERHGGTTHIELFWSDAADARASVRIPSMAFSPEGLPNWQWRLRTVVPPALGLLSVVWLATLAWISWRAIQWAAGPRWRWSAMEAAVLGLSFVLFVLGIWWGWPGGGGDLTSWESQR